MQNQYRNRRPQRNYQREERTEQNQKNQLIDVYNIFKYAVIWIILSLVAFGVKKLVMMGISMSPTGYVGNGMLTLKEVHNTGAAFNLFAGQPEMIITTSFFAVALLTFVLIVTSAKQSGTAVSAMAALAAGITMNMMERINLGYVVDYIHCDFAPNIPVFNVPDIYIVVGACCLILSVLTRK
ncbi:MAG: signal peptidase II [Candidatus Gastranaerophilales bacterium]|nr:signal peptidase II [Candidatus Gastranaerophilales bacterium]